MVSAAAGVGETRVVFSQWLPSEGTPKRAEALHVLVAPKSSPASSAVQKGSLPRQPSTPGVTVKQRMEGEEEGSKPVDSGGLEPRAQYSVAEGVQEGKVGQREEGEEEEGGGKEEREGGEEGGGEGERDEGVYVDKGEKEEGNEGEREEEVNVRGEEGTKEEGEKGGGREDGDKPACVEVVHEVEEGEHEAKPQGEMMSVSESVNQEGRGSGLEGASEGRRDGEPNMAEVMPRVESSESWVVVSAGASESHVKPHPHVRSAWEEDAQLPQTDHETATPQTTSQSADTGHKEGVMSVGLALVN